MSSEQRFDMSSDAIPSSWHEAASHAPQGTAAPLQKAGPMRAMPSGKSLDTFTATLSGAVVSIISGYLWFEVEMTTGKPYTWIALIVGMAIAIAVRIGGGPPDHQIRATISMMFYLLTSIVALFLIGRANYSETYGQSASLLDFESQLINTRLSDPMSALALAMGAVLAVFISYAMRRNR